MFFVFANWLCFRTFLQCFVVDFQLLHHVWLFGIPWTAAHKASLSFTIFQSLLKIMSTESVRPSNHHILCCHLLLLQSIFPSTRVFSNESALWIRWPNYWSFSISPSNEYSGLISFRIDWFDLLADQGTLNSLIQQHSSKPSIFQYSTFLMVQLSHLCITTWKTTALTITSRAKWCFCFLINCLGLWQLSFQEATIFKFCGCSHWR